MKNAIILGTIFLLLAISFILGIRSKKTSTASGFIGSSKSFGPIVIALSGTAAMASGWMLVGIPGDMYLHGNAMMNLSLLSGCFALSYIFLGKKIRALAELGDVATLGDILDIRYNNNKVIKGVTSTVIFIGCFSYLSSQIASGAGLFTYLFGWNTGIAAVVLFGVVIVYVAIGGESAGIVSQAFQGAIMVIAGIIITGVFFFKLGGFGGVMENLSSNPVVVGGNGVTSKFSPRFLDAFGGSNGAKSLAWFMMAFIGTTCQPATLTRMFALKNPRELPKLGVLTGVTQAVVCFCGLAIGYSVLSLVTTGEISPLAVADQATWHFGEYLGLGIQLIIYSAVMAAIISSASTYLSVGAAAVSKDLISCFGYKFNDKKQILISRTAIVLVGIIAIILATFSGETVGMLAALGWATFVSITLPVFVIGLVWKKANGKGMMAASITSLVGNIAGLFLLQTNIVWPAGLPWYMYLVCLSVIVGVFVSYFTYDEKVDYRDKYVEVALKL